MKQLDNPLVIRIDGITLVDDSAIGTKTRIARGVAERSLCREFYYATTPDGASPLALAEACRDFDIRLTLISTEPQGKELTPALQKARDMGAVVETVPTDFRDVSEIAKSRARDAMAEIFNFESELAINIVADFAKSLHLNPGQVWSASARGAMARGYQKAWPSAEHFSVVVLDVENADFGIARQIKAKAPYSPFAGMEVPFACNAFYEARAWPVAVKNADISQNPLFWNPAGP